MVWGGEDIVALSKEIAKWAKDLPTFEIKGGAVEGQTLDANGVDVLSKSPSREELIGQIAGLALSPGAQLAAAMLGPSIQLAGQDTGVPGPYALLARALPLFEQARILCRAFQDRIDEQRFAAAAFGEQVGAGM